MKALIATLDDGRRICLACAYTIGICAAELRAGRPAPSRATLAGAHEDYIRGFDESFATAVKGRACAFQEVSS
jgi:hypothetical protein